ncbi:helicase-related protein [Pelagibacteraceae bacterium]|nr:helicase-related protein [Pelagibacteraceae bacterium]
MQKKITNSFDTREYLIDELKKQLVGPQDGHFSPNVASFQITPDNLNTHRQEILTKNPRTIYTAGILFPQEALISSENNINEDFEEELTDDNLQDNQNDKIINDNNLIDDDLEKTTDNNFDIDLTNELRASAIGLSTIIISDKNLIIGVKDIGKYKTIGKEPSENLLLICYFLAKEPSSYEWLAKEFNIENNNQESIHNFLEKIFFVNNIKMKYRDYFDKFFSQRVGWRDRNDSRLNDIHNKFKLSSNDVLKKNILELINIEKKKIINDYKPVSGYGRESVSVEIEINKDEFKNKFIERNLKDQNNKEIGLKISIIVRSHDDKNKKYITVSLINTNISNKDKILVNTCFFQSNFYLKSNLKKEIIFHHLDQLDINNLSKEEQSLYLLHNKRKSYAIGHGCAASWKVDDDDYFKITSEIIPVYETKQLKAQEFSDLNLNMKIFSENIDLALNESKKLLNKYSIWLKNEAAKGNQFKNQTFKKISNMNIDKCKKILNRIEEGIKLLEINKTAQTAFKFMNLSMYLQQAHYQIKNFSNDLNYEKELSSKGKGNWRPFQLAFILLNLKSFIHPESEDRQIMDLIWFPTGGGKTEAYLGLTSFTIFLRKLTSKNEKGCAVLMRYTLRLLTTQQFQRAASLICACEKIRQDNQKILGDERISLGLWIGKESSPNKEKEARDILEEFIRNPNDSSKNKFVLLNCPWCSYDFIPKEGKPKAYKILGKKKQFHYVCPNKLCHFSIDQNTLPITVIDERIYLEPPTLLIGTIDKFASVTWLSEAIGMFDKFSKPDLIIQDELHLISGPLGSIAGMFEILLQALTEKNVNNKKVNAKIIGSTATISRAEKQVQNLYGKSCDIFPPQTNQLEDSFFSYEAKNEVGRKYVGVFCPSASSPQITLAKIISTMCLAVNEARIFSNNNLNAYDPYWTHLLYFNSIRELMSGSSLIQADVKGNLRGEYYRKGMTKEFVGDFFKEMRRGVYKVDELTSRVQSSAVPKILDQLFTQHNRENNNSLDLCLSTNMIQVGVDIPRLALMTIVGQPKTTSEYIQASSRVGRDKEKPGLVLTILSPFRPRDRSHYEKFHNYHENLYKFVEPTSITSHSDPVRSRCLHSIVIGLCRLWGESQRVSPEIPSEKLRNKIKTYIKKYVEKADPDHKEEIEKTDKEIDYIFETWENMKPQEYGKMVPISSQSSNSVLMIPAGSEEPPEGSPIPTLTSMRNVDKECNAIIIRKYRGKI